MSSEWTVTYNRRATYFDLRDFTVAFHCGNDRNWLREPVPLQDNKEQDNQDAESIARLTKYLEVVINLGMVLKVYISLSSDSVVNSIRIDFWGAMAAYGGMARVVVSYS